MDTSAGSLITRYNPTQKEKKKKSSVVMVCHYPKINVIGIKSS